MKRLGALILECDVCKQPFNGQKKPFHNVIVFMDGEIVEAADGDPVTFCSAECAAHSIADRKATAEPNTQYLYMPDE
jgi:hypothetical protein